MIRVKVIRSLVDSFCITVIKGLPMKSILLSLLILSQCIFPTTLVADDSEPSDVLPSYSRVKSLQGSINSIGSDTLTNLMTFWSQKFHEYYPQVTVEVEGKGSSTAPPALIESTASLGPMSREMKSSEVDAFQKRFSYKPTDVRVAVDALAVFVHRDNPLRALSLQELDAVFSRNRRRGGSAVATWGDLGLGGTWRDKPISIYGRNAASGTYGFFKETVMENGDFKASVKEQPGSASVVQSVSVDRYGIGYSGIGYKTAGVKVIALKTADDEQGVEASIENAYSGSYPLARFLLIYVNKEPGTPLASIVREFLFMVLSKEGQSLVTKDGYFPLPAAVVETERQKIEAP